MFDVFEGVGDVFKGVGWGNVRVWGAGGNFVMKGFEGEGL